MSYRDSYLLLHITRRGLKIHAREERGDVKATCPVNNLRRMRAGIPLKDRRRLEKAMASGKTPLRRFRRRDPSVVVGVLPRRDGKRDASPSAVAPAFQLECVFVANVIYRAAFQKQRLRRHVIG